MRRSLLASAFAVVMLLAGLYVLQYFTGVGFFNRIRGEISLSQEFMEEFDLSKLECEKVYEYIKDKKEYKAASLEEGYCRFAVPETEECFVYEVYLWNGEREPVGRMRWRLRLVPYRLDDWVKESVYFSHDYRSLYSCMVHVGMTGGDVSMYVCGSSVRECREKAEEYLLEIYHDLIKSNVEG